LDTLTKILLFPFTAMGTMVKITGRITAGIVGFLLMGAGLFLLDPISLPAVGIPLLVVGLLLTLRAVF